MPVPPIHHRLVLAFLALAPATLSSSCGQEAARAYARDGVLRGRIEVTGSSTCAPLVAEVARRFEELHPDVRVEVQTGGSSRGIADAASGLADVGMSSRALTASERQGRVEHVLARDGVAFLVHASNPVEGLSDDELLGIYTGRIERWSEVGGPDAEITVIGRADGRSELELVTDYLGVEPADLVADAIAGENQQGIKQVASDPRAITYMSVGTSEFEVSRGVPIRLLPLRGVEASSKSIAAGRFPLSRPLILITPPDPPPLVESFLAHARSAAVHDLVRDHSFVPLAD